MKKMRKIIPALAMLLVSAIMMSTASFAWFTMSASVTATGMTVKAQAAGGLVMSAAKVADGGYSAPGTNDYAATIDFSADGNTWYTNGASKIYPTSTNGTNWFAADAANADSHSAKTDVNGKAVYTNLGGSNITANNTYYLATKLYFKAVVENVPHNLYATSIQITSSNANNAASLDQALRVALKVGEKWFYFAPNYTGTPVLKHTTVSNSEYSAIAYTIGTSDGNISIGTDFTDVLLTSNLEYDEATEVEVYIYYEGEDENCKSAFAVNINELTISLNFTATANQ